MYYSSDVRIKTCMTDFRGDRSLVPILVWRGLAHPVFIADLVAQLADALNGDRFAMLFMAFQQKHSADEANVHVERIWSSTVKWLSGKLSRRMTVSI